MTRSYNNLTRPRPKHYDIDKLTFTPREHEVANAIITRGLKIYKPRYKDFLSRLYT